MTGDKLELWEERHARLQKALHCEPVDRVPVIFAGHSYAPYSQGMLPSEYCTDPEAAFEVGVKAVEELGDVDGLTSPIGGLIPVMNTTLTLSRSDIPGREVPSDAFWQIHEEEVMTIDDYDLIINEGWGAFRDYIFPKVHHLDLLEVHDNWLAENYAGLPNRYHEHGYDTIGNAMLSMPFEGMCGARSMSKFFLDCHRMPEKVKAALDAAQPWGIQDAIEHTDICGIKSVWIGGWRSSLVAAKVWNELVWPYYVDVITQLHAHGIFCTLHLDQNWDRAIEGFLELPRHSCALALDGTTDIRRAKRILGDHIAVIGDVPAAVLAAGTPEDVYAYVRELIRDLGPIGLVVNSGCDIPYNAPKANVQAIVDATHDFGTVAAAAAGA